MSSLKDLNVVESQPSWLKSTLMSLTESSISAEVPQDLATKYMRDDPRGYYATCRNCLIPLAIPNIDTNYAITCYYCTHHMPILKAPRGLKYVRCHCERVIFCTWKTELVTCLFCNRILELQENAILCSSLSSEPCNEPQCNCHLPEHLPKDFPPSPSYFPKALQLCCRPGDENSKHEFWITWTQKYMKDCRCHHCGILTSIPNKKQEFRSHKNVLLMFVALLLLVALILFGFYSYFLNHNILEGFILYAILSTNLYCFYLRFYFKRPNIIVHATKREFQKRFLI